MGEYDRRVLAAVMDESGQALAEIVGLDPARFRGWLVHSPASLWLRPSEPDVKGRDDWEEEGPVFGRSAMDLTDPDNL